MKIFSKEQIYEGDRLTEERQKISSVELMERAGEQIFNWMHLRMQGAPVPIHIFCGIGNNGGDGLVLARHLILHGYHVKTYIVGYSNKRSDDFLAHYERLKGVTKSWPEPIENSNDFPEIDEKDIIVDAIFGIGLNRPVTDWVKELFVYFRKTKAFTLSIDVPSGLFVDKPVADENDVVWAGFTLSFASPKLVFFLPETAKYTAQWEVLDIGLDPNYLISTETEAELISKVEVVPNYIPRDRFSHKGDFGHALVIGGSYGKIGAVTLTSKATLTTGAGLVTAYIPKCGYIPLQASFPEAMVITDRDEEKIIDIQFDIDPTVIGLGIGLGTHDDTIKALEAFLKTNKKPLVIDADGINILAKKKTLLKLLPENSILTPHPKELERLIGTWTDDFDKLSKVKAFTKKHKLIVIIKGAFSITVFNDKLYVNTTGNPGLATAGSGDVLTGIVLGLLSQGYHPTSAAIFGTYLHGKSADLAVLQCGFESLTASHVIEYIGDAFIDLFKQPEQPVEPETNTEAEKEKEANPEKQK
ncbi:NAD(P)H-hydrate dehydratase [Pseudotamlana carrageenivorans]|uniref:Bifunctional NAD(P)H-hydrate repair enzyme n=1 Tax=Pseudotamlana carrageenivorans TaxID=2069432 RepID=A0A2I7SLA6_9FLAO|nr:NAD(P)H-hydrate dehydratase [Tamlana carrageenivorans]AUS06706.1 bifunctional ADP-dependent NAD(P)H-hydrate dehydratase/NAD(P)H-hydrate epimerase [Tamlana carrageenivorans]